MARYVPPFETEAGIQGKEKGIQISIYSAESFEFVSTVAQRTVDVQDAVSSLGPY